MRGNNLLHQVIVVTEEYLGPAADRFIRRLINFHLKKSPELLSKSDLPKLTEWVKVSLGLLTDDKRLVDDCEKKLLELAGRRK